MITNPIIPIKIMIVICVILLLFKRKGIFPFIRQIVIIALLFVINLRPMIQSDNVKTQVTKRDAYVVFVIDDTLSMIAKDCAGGKTRLEAVYQDCEYIINELYGAKFSVVTFNNQAQIVSPYTDNAEYAISTIKAVKPLEELYAKGTTLNVSKEVMLTDLKNAAKKGDGKIILFYISDGEMNSENSLESFAEAADYIDDGAVMGYGTTAGGKMYYESYDGSTKTVKDSNYDDAVSKIDEGNLKELAKDMEIDYVHMTSKEAIDDVLNNVKAEVDAAFEDGISVGYMDIYWIFIIPLALMVVFEFFEFKRKV